MTSKASPAEYKDRSSGLALFGILMIMMGFAAGGLGLLMLFFTSAFGSVSASSSIGLIMYMVIGAVLITLGIGSISACRWARALILILSWYWLGMGIVAGITLVTTLPTLMDHFGQNLPGLQTAQFLKTFVMVLSSLVFFVIYVLIPGTLILFYRSPNVKATCEAKNPQVSWTDKAPLPLLGLSVLYGVGALAFVLVLPFYGFLFPFFGVLLTGFPGAVATAVVGLTLLYASVELYQMQKTGWWAALGFTLVVYASALVTFSRVGLQEIYQKIQMPVEQLEAIRKTGLLDSNFMLVELSLSGALITAYLIWVKRYFPSKSN